MFRADLFRTVTFRLTLAFVVAIIAGMALQFGLVYGQMNGYEQQRSTDLLQREAALLVRETPAQLEYEVRERSKTDLRVILNGAALFDMSRNLIAGDIKKWPVGLEVSPRTQRLWDAPPGDTPYEMRYLAVEVEGVQGNRDRILVLARSLHMANELRYITKRAALMSVVPVVAFALMAGIFLSHRALRRVKEMHEAIDRIMDGDLHERLPAGRERDDIERLAVSVNRMLDRLEHLLDEIRDVGNDIAHDLRTPLARVKARLERVSAITNDPTALHGAIERATQDLEQCFSVITALLRIGEIENGRRRAGFAMLDLRELLVGVVDLYEPIAETQDVLLRIAESNRPVPLFGDKDLLNEVLVNLVDNAIKFTPAPGSVDLSVGQEPNGASWLRVADTGIGIAEEERRAVMGRFYRSDKSRHVPGSGLGLSLVSAILRLHGASLEIGAARTNHALPGAVFTIHFPVAATA
ncbi:sensor histidine kinase [Gluconobacter kanchanaburiensis]|uniref:sensor histidine kinase n=1 Tax=Gluconobacter kanchanaburiensis TaxID=563199 RepID=UPI0011BEBA20|nr:HAMP domain-containing sensor histidine kinase [Gluconobacter kanchanaburiensis]MBF0861352.1 HAMP domain-containing histidine kinase [Gluconobacter kanchanaburiensis]